MHGCLRSQRNLLLMTVFTVTLGLFTKIGAAHAAETPTFEAHDVVVAMPYGADHIYAEIARGTPGKGTFVFVNGLIYDLKRWDPLSQDLLAKGYTVIRFALIGQPESLRLGDQNQDPKFFSAGLALSDLDLELNQVLQEFGADKTKIQLVGLSYGASVAVDYALHNADQVANLILIAPLVVPLETYQPAGRSLRIWLNSVRTWEDGPCEFYGAINPLLCAQRDYWYNSFYNYFYENYLSERISKIPDGVSESVFKRAVFHLVRAARDFDLKLQAPALKNVHFILAENEETPLLADQREAYDRVLQAEQKGLSVIPGASHAIPDSNPEECAQILSDIAQ